MIVRLGRVLFWFGVAGAAYLSLGAAVITVTGRFGDGIGMLIIAAILLGVGRGARYVLANE